jgi:hypothetical protein
VTLSIYELSGRGDEISHIKLVVCYNFSLLFIVCLDKMEHNLNSGIKEGVVNYEVTLCRQVNGLHASLNVDHVFIRL